MKMFKKMLQTDPGASLALGLIIVVIIVIAVMDAINRGM